MSYEEYSPYGSTTYQAVRSQLQTPKRYRYTGMERDDESGLSYHSARYYAPWLGRWTSADPVGLTGSTNLYDYSGGNPINRVDPAETDWEFCNPFTDEQCGLDSTAVVARDYVPEHEKFTFDVGVGVTKGAVDTVVGLKDLAVGLYRVSDVNRVLDHEQWVKSNQALEQTVSTIWNDPGVLWEAIKEPYVKAIDEGRPGEAVGRGLFEIVAAVVGTKGADKVAKGSKVGAAVSKVDDVVNVANKVDDVAKVTTKVDDLAKPAAGWVNLDTGSAVGFVAEGSPVRGQLKAAVEGRQMVMTETALGEFQGTLRVAGPQETVRAGRLLERTQIIPDNPSARVMGLRLTKKVDKPQDLIIFGIGDKRGIPTMTNDAKFVRGAAAQGVELDVILHPPVSLRGR